MDGGDDDDDVMMIVVDECVEVGTICVCPVTIQ